MPSQNSLPKPKVIIQYGIASGKRQGVRFRSALHQAGYEVVHDLAEANIIIAHSAGCFWLPAAPTHQKILLIDPPYWPEKTIHERGLNRLKTNLRYRQYYETSYWLQRNMWGIFYSLKDFARTRQIVQHASTFDLLKVVQNHNAILVRNQDDDWLTPDIDHIAAKNGRLKIVRMPGDHDDCLYNPAPYVKLLDKLLHLQ